MIVLAHAPQAGVAQLIDQVRVSLDSLVGQGLDCWEAHVVVCEKHCQIFKSSIVQDTRLKWHVVNHSSDYRLDIQPLLKKVRTQWVGWMYAGDVLRPDFLYWVLKPILTTESRRDLVTFNVGSESFTQGHKRPPYMNELAQQRLAPDLQWEAGYLDANFIVRKDFALNQVLRNPLMQVAPLNSVRALANRLVLPLRQRKHGSVFHIRQRLLSRSGHSRVKSRLQDSVKSKREVLQDLTRLLKTIDPRVCVSTFNQEKAWLQVDWPSPRQRPRAHVVIPTRDRLDVLKPCIRSLLRRTDYPNYEVTVIDNGSVEKETLKYLGGLPKKAFKHNINLSVLRDDRPFNFSALNNHVVRPIRDGVLVFLNNDIEIVEPEWLDQMVRHAMRPDVGCVGAKLLYPDGTIQHLGVTLGATHIASHLYSTEHPMRWPTENPMLSCTSNPIAVTAAALAIRAELFHLVGGFNEDQLAVAYNDVDLCLRAEELGFRTVCTPRATMIHHESMTRKLTDQHDLKRERQESSWMRRRWSKQLALDSGISIL